MRKIDAFFALHWSVSVTVAVLWQLFMTVVGYYFVRTSLLAHTVVYDGKWYQNIIEKTLRRSAGPRGFLPLFHEQFAMPVNSRRRSAHGAYIA